MELKGKHAFTSSWRCLEFNVSSLKESKPRCPNKCPLSFTFPPTSCTCSPQKRALQGLKYKCTTMFWSAIFTLLNDFEWLHVSCHWPPHDANGQIWTILCMFQHLVVTREQSAIVSQEEQMAWGLCRGSEVSKSAMVGSRLESLYD